MEGPSSGAVDVNSVSEETVVERSDMLFESPLKALEEHAECLEKCCDGENDLRYASAFRMLDSIEPSFALATRPPEVSGDASQNERAWLFESFVKPATQGLILQTRLDFDSSSSALNRVYPVLSRMGGTMVQRDLISQTLILFFLRANRLVEARLLLCERTTLTPNDAQSWRRLASVFARMGEDTLAEVAHYTAWQLGIGQGGFGGPK